MKNCFPVILLLSLICINANAQDTYVSKINETTCVEIDLRWEGTTVFVTRSEVRCSPSNKMTLYNLTSLKIDDNGYIEFGEGSYYLIPFENIAPARQNAPWTAECSCEESGGGSCTVAPSSNTVSCTPHSCMKCVLYICWGTISGGGILVKADRVIVQ